MTSGDMIIEMCVQVIARVRKYILDFLNTDIGHALASGQFEGKDMKRIDQIAEEHFKYVAGKVFRENRIDDVRIVGEERLPEGLSSETRTCLLIDVLDGTDLLELSVPLWCSAVAVFNPHDCTMIGSVVSLGTGDTYSSSSSSSSSAPSHVIVRQMRNLNILRAARGPSARRSLKNCTVSFYGQKAGRLSEESIQRLLYKLIENDSIRIQTLAGNPVLAMLADARKHNGTDVGRSFDIVIETKGQFPHDMAAGAYIAMQAGAVLCDLSGNILGEEWLARACCTPRVKVTYILSATRELADTIISLLKS